MLNQLVTLKNLANRKAFSLSDNQFAELSSKFRNLYDQRMRHRPDVSPRTQ